MSIFSFVIGEKNEIYCLKLLLPDDTFSNIKHSSLCHLKGWPALALYV